MGPALSPVVHGSRSFFRSILWIHTAGQALGGLALGLVMGLLGSAVHALGDPARIGLALAAAVYAASEVSPWQVLRVNSTWQVPEHYRRTRYVRSMAFLWGVTLGFGWLTASSAMLAVACLGMIAAPPSVALLAGTAFGTIRGLTLLLGVGAEDFESVVQRYAAIKHRLRAMSIASAVLGGLVAITILAPLQ